MVGIHKIHWRTCWIRKFYTACIWVNTCLDRSYKNSYSLLPDMRLESCKMDTHKILLKDFLGYFHFVHGDGPENKNNGSSNNNNKRVYFKERDFVDQRRMDNFPWQVLILWNGDIVYSSLLPHLLFYKKQ